MVRQQDFRYDTSIKVTKHIFVLICHIMCLYKYWLLLIVFRRMNTFEFLTMEFRWNLHQTWSRFPQKQVSELFIYLLTSYCFPSLWVNVTVKISQPFNFIGSLKSRDVSSSFTVQEINWPYYGWYPFNRTWKQKEYVSTLWNKITLTAF